MNLGARSFDPQFAAGVVAKRLGVDAASTGLGVVLGSGMMDVTNLLEDSRSVAFAEIPGFAPATVAGHAGEIHAGRSGGATIIMVAGRVHVYEGHSLAFVAQTVRTLAALGTEKLLLCNSAGGINSAFQAGSIMLLEDVINLTFRNPLIGAGAQEGERFPDMSRPFDTHMNSRLRRAALAHRIPLHQGVYAGVTGPSYETAAEIRMLARLGADAVGMSTVPEVIAARALGMRCAALSCITNRAAGLSAERLSHEKVVQAAATAMEKIMTLITGLCGFQAK